MVQRGIAFGPPAVGLAASVRSCALCQPTKTDRQARELLIMRRHGRDCLTFAEVP